MSLVKSTSWKGGDRLKKDFYALRHGLCMCAIQRVNRPDKIFKCLWTGYGSRSQAHQFVQRCWISHSQQFQEWSTTQKTSNHFDTTTGSIGVNMDQHPCGTFLTPCRVHALMNWGCSEWKRGVHLNNRNVFVMFNIVCVCVCVCVCVYIYAMLKLFLAVIISVLYWIFMILTRLYK
jgi:hypothetical protein